ncbi:sulfatase [Flavobacteriaceae bacterium F89]|uniref:Sulfatase n=1 Tax=Cerina litoralis TaxID=2874477 RepID=A0AAE3EV74_9FLAO|nr:sulfatase [Cerina litoralis]MCG2460252.1 sulfatase [Cerina litoralis]
MGRIRLVLMFMVIGGAITLNAQSQPPKNILLICVDDLRPELASFGAPYIHSPNMDKLAAQGRAFPHHYVNAPSCGPSRYTLLTGVYGPSDNNALFFRADEILKDAKSVTPSMPEWFRKNGYTTVSVGKVSHHPGGLGGPDWDDPHEIEMPNAWDRRLMPVGEWQHPRGAMHGLAHGEIRQGRGTMEVYQSAPGPDTIYPDGLIVSEALNQLDILTADKSKPFFLAVGILKPHLPFGAPKNYLEFYKDIELPAILHPEKPQGISTWHDSGEFMQYNRWGKDPRNDDDFATDVRRHYAACVSYADAQVGRILKKLRETGADKNTIIVLWGDHGWNLGEHNIWGKHNLFEEALRSPLIVSYPGIEHPGENAEGMVETVDIFPTLCDLTEVNVPNFLIGTSFLPILDDPKAKGQPAVGYYNKAKTIRTPDYRLIFHDSGEIELYDENVADKEVVNIADSNPEIVLELKAELDRRLKSKHK